MFPRLERSSQPPVRPTSVLAACLLAAVGARAQCSDPTPPPGGFPIQSALGQTVLYATGEQTKIDVYAPSESPCPGGWPVVILVHPLGGTRESVADRARELSAQGYVTAAYDVAGQGASTAGLEYYGEQERLDLAEIVAYLDATYGGWIADISRLGISGASQGGHHAWAAAAWSGKALPANARGITTFPTFRAAVPQWAPPVDASYFDPLAATPFQVGLFSSQVSPGLRWGAAFYAVASTAIATENFAALANLVSSDPWRADLLNLRTSTVPVLAHLSWHDAVFSVDHVLDAYAAMPASTPKRLFLSEPGHGEAQNVRQVMELNALEQRWFDRFLKGEANQVDLEPPVVAAVVPEEPGSSGRSKLLWNRHLQQWPPANASPTRYYLRDSGQLSTTPPVGTESPDSVVHSVPAGANMAALMAVGMSGEAQLRSWFLPASTKSYDTEVLTEDVEIAGSIRLELEVMPTGPDYQVGCILLQVDARGDEHYVQSAVVLERGNAASRRHVVDFTDVNAFVSSGHRLRLRLQDVATRRPKVVGGPPSFRVVPYFRNVSVGLVHTGMRPSWIEIPMRPVEPVLSSAAVVNSVTAPRDVVYVLEGSERLAGSPYLIMFGLSGIVPPTPLPGGQALYLKLDPLSSALAAALPSPLLPGCAGTLSANGEAVGGIAWSMINPFPWQLHRARLHAAAVVLNHGVLGTNPVDLWFQ